MVLPEKTYQTQYTCQCGTTNTAYLMLNNALDRDNYGKQFYEFVAECMTCKVFVRMKFDTEPFTHGQDGDPYKSNITQHTEFLKFDFKEAIESYYKEIYWKLNEALKLVDKNQMAALEKIIEQQKKKSL
jgi:hypothetical protein